MTNCTQVKCDPPLPETDGDVKKKITTVVVLSIFKKKCDWVICAVAGSKRDGDMVKKVFFSLFAAILVGVTAPVVYYFFYPDVSTLKKVNPKKTSFMEYRERQWKQEGRKGKVQQRWVPLGRISPYAVKAVIIAEDDKFWRHEGFDFEAIQKALEKDLQKRSFKVGGSTISQQLAKNLYLTPSKNPIRKIKEAIITWRLERNLSKRRIIELYLNFAEWGDGIFGIELAAQRYFGKAAEDLTAAESARLAAVLPNPLKYNPVGDSAYVKKRAERIYGIMVRRGIVIPEYEEVVKEPFIEEGTLTNHDPAAMKQLEQHVEAWKKERDAARPGDRGEEGQKGNKEERSR